MKETTADLGAAFERGFHDAMTNHNHNPFPEGTAHHDAYDDGYREGLRYRGTIDAEGFIDQRKHPKA
jgi:hypothetical protein